MVVTATGLKFELLQRNIKVIKNETTDWSKRVVQVNLGIDREASSIKLTTTVFGSSNMQCTISDIPVRACEGGEAPSYTGASSSADSQPIYFGTIFQLSTLPCTIDDKWDPLCCFLRKRFATTPNNREAGFVGSYHGYIMAASLLAPGWFGVHKDRAQAKRNG